jgi:hypothetical protein
MRKQRLPREEWVRIVKSWRRSKLDAVAFAAREDSRISARTLVSWARRLEEPGVGHGEREDLKFIEVGGPETPEAHLAGSVIEVTLTGGISLRLGAGTSAERVAELVRSLEAR